MIGAGTERRVVVPTRTLVLSAVGADGSLDAEPLFAMATAVGHSDKAMRDCLARGRKGRTADPCRGAGPFGDLPSDGHGPRRA